MEVIDKPWLLACVGVQWLDANPGAEEDDLAAKLKEIEAVANPIISR